MEPKDEVDKNEEIEEALKEFETKSNTLSQEKQFSNSSKVDGDLEIKAEGGIEDALKEFEAESNVSQKEKQPPEDSKTDENLDFKKDLKIGEALNEFETKYEIEEQRKQSLKKEEASKTSKMVRLVMKLSGGLVKEERQAEYVLLAIAILFFLASGVIFFITTNKNKIQQVPEIPIQMKIPGS